MSILCQDSSTLTDLHADDDVDEVNLVSLITEVIPTYHLRADSATRFGGYFHQDWVQWPALSEVEADKLNLTAEQCYHTLEYFVLCGARVSHMTRTYDDMEAVTRLLEEKEHDLELAAKIGQSLLEKNRVLECRVEQLESELTDITERYSQVQHDLVLKDELLRIYAQDMLAAEAIEEECAAIDNMDYKNAKSDTGSGMSSTRVGSLGSSVSSSSGFPLSRFDITHLERRMKDLEDENGVLKCEHKRLQQSTEKFEDVEQSLVKDCIKQLAEANCHIKCMSEDLNKKTDMYIRQQEELTNLLAKTIDQDNRIKRLLTETEQKSNRLKEAQNAQHTLTVELASLHDKYDECLGLLDESHQEIRILRKKSRHAAASGMAGYVLAPHPAAASLHGPSSAPLIASQPGGYWPGLAVTGDSLAAELQSSVIRGSEQGADVGAGAGRVSANLRALTTAKSVKQCSTDSNSVYDSWDSESLASSDSTALEVDESYLTFSHAHLGSRNATRPRSLLSSRTSHSSYLTERDVSCLSGNNNSRDIENDEIKPSTYSNLSTVPGVMDLEAAIQRIHREHDQRRRMARYRYASESSGCSTPAPSRTPDSVMSCGSSPPSGQQPSLPTQPLNHEVLSQTTTFNLAPEKLRLVKPLEGSLTLGHWQRLAQPSLTGLFEDRPGIQTRNVQLTEILPEYVVSSSEEKTLNLSDIEEDDDFCRIRVKSWNTCSATFTFSTSHVLHPSDNYNANAPLICTSSLSTNSRTSQYLFSNANHAISCVSSASSTAHPICFVGSASTFYSNRKCGSFQDIGLNNILESNCTSDSLCLSEATPSVDLPASDFSSQESKICDSSANDEQMLTPTNSITSMSTTVFVTSIVTETDSAPAFQSNLNYMLNYNSASDLRRLGSNAVTSTFSMSRGLATILRERGICGQAEMKLPPDNPPELSNSSIESKSEVSPADGSAGPVLISNLTETVIRNLGLGAIFSPDSRLFKKPSTSAHHYQTVVPVTNHHEPVTCAIGLNLFGAPKVLCQEVDAAVHRSDVDKKIIAPLEIDAAASSNKDLD